MNMKRDEKLGINWAKEENTPVTKATVAQIEVSESTASSEVEKKLRESEERYHSLVAMFEQVHVGIAFARLDGQLIQVNQQYCDIVGYTREELLERKFQDI